MLPKREYTERDRPLDQNSSSVHLDFLSSRRHNFTLQTQA